MNTLLLSSSSAASDVYKRQEHPVAIRVPATEVISCGEPVDSDYSILNRYKVTHRGSKVAIVALGSFYGLGQSVASLLKEKENIDATLINPRYITGIDSELMNELKADHELVITLEDGVLDGGFGEKISRYYGTSDMKVLNYGAKKEFVDRYDLQEFLRANHLTDEQIVEDIFAIAYGIALGKFVQKEYLEKLSSWIVENVYSEEGLFKYENSAIRYYCKGIVKIAISKGLCDAECEKRISEKYIRKSSFMPAYKDSFDSKRLSGYGPIYYDLARYVLCDHLDRFFCINYKTREYLRETEKFIEKYKKEYDVDMLAPEGLIISIAFQYLLNQGWDEKIFWECEDKNNLGIDICIRNTYMRSTHGAKSKVMTVAEKYVWCVKHRMEAVFASQLQYNYYGQGVRYISDYYEIDDFTNTYQDYVNSRYTKIEDKWIHTDQMVKTPYKEFFAENIEKWMKKKDTPDFTVWLGEKTDARILYAYTNIVNEVLGIEEAIWISSGIVKNNDFEKLIAEVNVYSEERSELLNVAEFHSYVETCGFYTPQEVCAVQSVKEANESINIGNEKNVIQVYKLVATCLSEHIENIEKTFYLPSRIARILTGITYGDGYEYINDNNEVVCKYSDVSKGENNQQECLQINSHILESSLKENDYRMFWVFRVYRSPSSKAYELYGNDITHDTDRSYIVWFDEEKSRYIELKEIEPVIAENNNDYVLKVKSLYDRLDD